MESKKSQTQKQKQRVKGGYQGMWGEGIRLMLFKGPNF